MHRLSNTSAFLYFRDDVDAAKFVDIAKSINESLENKVSSVILNK